MHALFEVSYCYFTPIFSINWVTGIIDTVQHISCCISHWWINKCNQKRGLLKVQFCLLLWFDGRKIVYSCTVWLSELRSVPKMMSPIHTSFFSRYSYSPSPLPSCRPHLLLLCACMHLSSLSLSRVRAYISFLTSHYFRYLKDRCSALFQALMRYKDLSAFYLFWKYFHFKYSEITQHFYFPWLFQITLCFSKSGTLTCVFNFLWAEHVIFRICSVLMNFELTGEWKWIDCRFLVDFWLQVHFLFQYLNIFLTRADGLRRMISASTAVKDGMNYAVLRDIFQV